MTKLHRVLSSICILILSFLSGSALWADILITHDGMTLNGKVIDNTPGQPVVFVNSYGSFTIKHSQIKELRITASYQEDVELMKSKGLQPNVAEFEKNYLAGDQAKREKTKETDTDSKPRAIDVFAGASYSRIFGRLAPRLGTGFGAFAGVFSPLSQTIPASLGIDGIEYSAKALYSKKQDRSITAFSLCAGPRWSFPLPLSSVGAAIDFAPSLGAGWYKIQNGSETVGAIKADISVQAGPTFQFGTFIIASRLNFVYITDVSVPLYSLGISITGGMRF